VAASQCNAACLSSPEYNTCFCPCTILPVSVGAWAVSVSPSPSPLAVSASLPSVLAQVRAPKYPSFDCLVLTVASREHFVRFQAESACQWRRVGSHDDLRLALIVVVNTLMALRGLRMVASSGRSGVAVCRCGGGDDRSFFAMIMLFVVVMSVSVSVAVAGRCCDSRGSSSRWLHPACPVVMPGIRSVQGSRRGIRLQRQCDRGAQPARHAGVSAVCAVVFFASMCRVKYVDDVSTRRRRRRHPLLRCRLGKQDPYCIVTCGPAVKRSRTDTDSGKNARWDFRVCSNVFECGWVGGGQHLLSVALARTSLSLPPSLSLSLPLSLSLSIYLSLSLSLPPSLSLVVTVTLAV
jgi:hypothetical protein